MRTLEEVNQDILNTCSKIGQIEYQKTKLLSESDRMLLPLHQKVDELKEEAVKIKAVLDEVAKQKDSTV